MTQSAQQPTAIKSVFLKSLLGISFAAVLALAPAPAFAQHGGGGGGGGAHGGGGGGGSHGSSGGGHASGSGSGSHPTSNGSSAGNTATSGHWWNPFHGNGTNNGAAPKAGGTGAGANAANSASANTRFAAGNNTWQDPPVNARTNTPSHFFASSNSGAAASANRMVHRPIPNGGFGPGGSAFRRRPIIFFPFNPFLFGNGFGFGFGFGCDPWLWGCPQGFGFGFDDSLGYYGGGAGYGYAGGSDMTFQYNGTEPDATSGAAPTLENNSDWQSAPDNNSNSQPDDSKAQPYVVIFLRDGSSYAVSDYWLAGGKLHYVTSYGGENSVDANQLDLQRTVNENSAHGVTFTLRPAATDTPGTKQPLQPAPSNDSQPPATNPQ